MTRLQLTLRHAPVWPQDASLLCPDALAGLSASAVLRLPLSAARRSICLGDLFTAEGNDPADLVIRGDCRVLHRVGALMTAGRLRVEGDVGDAVGQGMRGGQLIVEGSAGDDAGQSMRGGELRIGGDAGERLGAPDLGERSGISGGVIVVGGSAGAYAGHRMRRGMLLIAGSAGDHCAAGMVAGTLAVGRGVSGSAAVGMRRGTLLLAQPADPPQGTFTAPQPAQSLGFLGMLIQQVAAELPSFGQIPLDRWQRCLGDRAVAGLGELISPCS